MERRDAGPERTERARELRRLATPWERILWKGLRRGPLHWRRSHPLQGFYLDLYCDAARLAVEADGARHDAGYDDWRYARLLEGGVLTLRFTNVEIGADPEGCLRRVREVAQARAEALALENVGDPEPPPCPPPEGRVLEESEDSPPLGEG